MTGNRKEKKQRFLLTPAIALMKTWQMRYRTRVALRHLSPHLCRDIGISRDEAAREATKPFWRP